jgi:hypothetical protein
MRPAPVGGQGWPWAFPKVKIPLTSYFPSLFYLPPTLMSTFKPAKISLTS